MPHYIIPLVNYDSLPNLETGLKTRGSITRSYVVYTMVNAMDIMLGGGDAIRASTVAKHAAQLPKAIACAVPPRKVTTGYPVTNQSDNTYL